MIDRHAKDHMSDAWLNEGLEESIRAAVAKEQSAKGVAAVSEAEPMREEKLQPLEGPDSQTVGSQSSGAISAASQQESEHEEQKGRTKEVRQRKTATYDRQNSGALFKNKFRKTDQHPDYTGHAVVGGAEFWISAWIKQGENGKFMSLAFRSKNANVRPAETPF